MLRVEMRPARQLQPVRPRRHPQPNLLEKPHAEKRPFSTESDEADVCASQAVALTTAEETIAIRDHSGSGSWRLAT